MRMPGSPAGNGLGGGVGAAHDDAGAPRHITAYGSARHQLSTMPANRGRDIQALLPKAWKAAKVAEAKRAAEAATAAEAAHAEAAKVAGPAPPAPMPS